METPEELVGKLLLQNQLLQARIGTPIGTIERIIIGIMAGLAAVCVKILRQDLDSIKGWWVSTRPEDITSLQSLFLSYYFLVPCLLFLGAVLCWLAVNETSKIKLFAIGLAAPAVITTLAGGPKQSPPPPPVISTPGPAGWNFDIGIVTTAHAQTASSPCASGPSLIQGLKIFFGEPRRYYVIVGGYKSKAEADAKAKEVNEEDPTVKAFVGKRKPCNDYYPVVVGDYLPQDEASKLLQKAKKLDSADNVYLSDYPDRRPDK
jgi:SPOR domain